MPKNNFKLAAIYEEGLLRWENIRSRNMLDHPLAWDQIKQKRPVLKNSVAIVGNQVIVTSSEPRATLVIYSF